MSEAHVGTDVLNMKTLARLDNDHYVINGQKMWITNGALDEKKTSADCVLLYAMTKKGERRSISTFLVEKGHSGYYVGAKN